MRFINAHHIILINIVTNFLNIIKRTDFLIYRNSVLCEITIWFVHIR